MRRFVPPVVPKSLNKSLRFPTKLYEHIFEALDADTTFTAFVMSACREKLESLKTRDK